MNGKTNNRRLKRLRGFTLLEMLLVLVLIVVMLGGVAALVRVFSNSYTADERRVGRAQLARSISQMLDEDLGSAVQDPIQAVAEDSNRQFIRHFGLRGDSRSLQIDVVQPSLFANIATTEENARVSSGGDKSPNARQVPELKTVFYEFVPINATEGESDEQDAASSSLGSDFGEDLGSTLAGSLSSVAGDELSAGLDSSQNLPGSDAFFDGTRPLVQKFGLSRRELDYETPDDKEEEDDFYSGANGVSIDRETRAANVSLSGSLTTPPDARQSQLTSTDPQINALLGVPDDSQYVYKEPMTALQIAMDSDDGTTWAPEVLDCRFSYFDGTDWQDSWDSIEKRGLPIAIKTELKLAPLDDVDLYRSSPLIYSLPTAPDPETLSKLKAQIQGRDGDDVVNTSRLAGSLTRSGAETKGTPVDVFNSYRPLDAIRAALEGVRLDSINSSAFSQIAYSSELTRAFEQEAENAASLDGGDSDDALELGMGGGLNDSPDAGSAASGALGGATTQDDGDPALRAIQEMVAGGAVFNESGVCVDFSNDGSYITLEQMAAEIGVAEPIVYELIVYLPTTPLSRATTFERRKPTVTRAGVVSQRRNPNQNNARARRERGENPYATGRARQFQERNRTERTATERTARNRNAADRQVAERGANNRQVAGRGEVAQRGAAERGTRERTGGPERGAGTRSFQERRGANGGWTEPALTESPGPTPGVVDGSRPGGVPVDPIASNSAPPTPPASTGGLTGGLAGTGGATQIDGLSPFAIVDQQNAAIPFASANSDFDPIAGATTPGLIEEPSGAPTVVSPTSTPQAPRQQQTWIRGKK